MNADSQSLVTFSEWLATNAVLFLIVVASAIVVGLLFGYVVAAFRHGAVEGFYEVAQVIGQMVPDFLNTSFRRVMAIAGLAIKEALRRKVVLATFAIFAITLLFGGWFMNSDSEQPDKVYVSFVMFGTQLLVLMMGMLISSFSLPDDIKNKTIYTIVTKPVRSTEVVMGRLVGFGLLGTGLLILMGLLSYIFVWRGLAHTHQVVGETQTLASFVEVGPDKMSTLTKGRASETAILEAVTNPKNGHFHRLEVVIDKRLPSDPQPIRTDNIVDKKELPDGSIEYQRVICLPKSGHRHRVFVEGTGKSAKITIGPAVGYFRARVPVYAKSLLFHDRNGDEKATGINVGKESKRRGYISGGTPTTKTSLSDCEFSFEGFYPSKFPQLSNTSIIPLEMDLAVYRSYKADIEKGVMAGIQFESVPDEAENKFVSDMLDFETKEFTVQTLPIKRKLVGKVYSPDGTLVGQGEYDLFDDFAKNGRLKLVMKCRDYNQYLGVALKDVYFRPNDAVYGFNFFKGFFGIWCQMMIVIAIGVALSASLSAPITMLGTIVVIILGFFSGFIQGLVAPDNLGGGTFESLIRVVTQKNMMQDLDTGWFVTIVKNIDYGISMFLYGLTFLAPDFSTFNFSDDLARGYSIGSNRVLIALSLTFVFCCGFTILGYFSLKTREIAK
jgi:hypothetical protein